MYVQLHALFTHSRRILNPTPHSFIVVLYKRCPTIYNPPAMQSKAGYTLISCSKVVLHSYRYAVEDRLRESVGEKRALACAHDNRFSPWTDGPVCEIPPPTASPTAVMKNGSGSTRYIIGLSGTFAEHANEAVMEAHGNE